jgi:aryl-alcohol dehydrogenase-like predicted oxidoreductase
MPDVGCDTRGALCRGKRYLRLMANHQSRQLGSSGPRVFPLGLGCMGMSDLYGPADESESIATIHAALDAGVTLFDTGDYYAAGHNEMLIGRALRDHRDKALISVKFGALRGPDGSWIGMDTRPVAVKSFAAYSLRRLGVDHIDIYRPGRLDPSVPIEDTIGAIADLVGAGYVRAIGLSEVGPDTIRRAHAVHPVSDLQIEYSIISRGPETRIFPLLSELGIGVTAYGVLSRGLLSGWTPKSGRDVRAHLPRFAGENLERNARLVEALHQMAAEKGATASQLAIAWVLAKGPASMVPLVGARTRRQLTESLGALQMTLSPEDTARIEAALPSAAVAGTRYDERQMRVLDSEREGGAPPGRSRPERPGTEERTAPGSDGH